MSMQMRARATLLALGTAACRTAAPAPGDLSLKAAPGDTHDPAAPLPALACESGEPATFLLKPLVPPLPAPELFTPALTGDAAVTSVSTVDPNAPLPTAYR